MEEYGILLYEECINDTSLNVSQIFSKLIKRYRRHQPCLCGEDYDITHTLETKINEFIINNEEKIDTIYFHPVYRLELECISHLHHVKTIDLQSLYGNKPLNMDTNRIENLIINSNITLHPDLDIKNIKRIVVKLAFINDFVISSEDGLYTIGKVKLPMERHIELDLSGLFCFECKHGSFLDAMITHSVPISKIIYNIDRMNGNYIYKSVPIIDCFLVEYKRRVNPDVEYDILNFHKLFPMYTHQCNLEYIKNIGSKLFLKLPKIIVFSIFKIMREKTVHLNDKE